MAGEDSGGLLVQIGVTQARMERELAKLVKDASKAAQQTENAFQKANDNVAKGSQRAFGGVGRGAQQATGAIKNTSGATSNLASQLNDIGVQLAGGQSPFLIMLQQGTQISQIFNQTGGTLKSFGSILSGAVMSALNPFSLLTFAVIAAGGTAIQYFSGLISGGEDANKVIAEQQKLVEGVAKQWGDAVPALQAYVAELERASSAADLVKAGEIVNQETVATVRGRIEEIRTSFQDLIFNLQAAGEESDTILRLQDAFNQFTAAANEGKDVTAETKAVQDALTEAINSSGIPAISEWAGMFGVLAGAAASAAKAVATVNAQVAQAMNGPSIQDIVASGTFTDKDGKVRSKTSFTPIGSPPTPESRPTIELDGLPGQFKPNGSLAGRKGGGGGSSRGANAYKDEVTGIKERTAALRESTAAQAAVNPLVSDYGFALEKAKAEQKLLADAQRSGLKVTPELREQISELATGYADASAEAKKLSEEQREIQRNAEEWASLEKDVFKGFISDLKEGKSGAEALSNALNKVADKLLDMALDGLFSTKGGAAGGGGSGLFGSILGGIGKIFGFASGTARTPGRRGQPAGIVHGQEAVIPLPAGGKVPVTISSPTVQKSKGSNDLVRLVLQDDSGRMADVADQRIRTASGAIVQVSVEQSFKTVKANMGGLITDTQSRQF